VSDLVGNHVALGIIDPPSGMAQIEAKQLKTSRSPRPSFPRLPQIPTLAESGLPGFESNGWFGIVVPAATPSDVIATLNMALVKVLNEPDVVERIRALGAEPMPMTPTENGAFIRTEIDKWLKVVSAGKPN
jgi:tripartite-type tricarboxylate transporter receptor subunit TctC